MILSTRDAFQSLYMTAWHLHRARQDDLITKFKQMVSPQAWWLEMGAFVATFPRQSGKSTLISKMLYEIGYEPALIINPIAIQKKYVVYDSKHSVKVIYGPSGPYLVGMNFKDTHLFIDEYTFVNDLDKVLSHDWKTVTMLGTLRIQHE